MRLTALLALGVLALAALVLWSSGALGAIGWWAAGQQRALQDALAGTLGALRAGEPAAALSLIGLCAGYGFMHALGPGHGKALIAGASVATQASARRMATIALAGSLAQAGGAIVLVYGAFALIGATARGIAEGAERWIAPAGDLVIALLGAWLLACGVRALATPAASVRAGCGHDHGPAPDRLARATSPAATLALIAGMAARPCTGAIFVLAVAWRMGVPGIGAAGVLAMGLGVAAFTGLVAWAAVTSREAAFLGAGGGGARLLGPGLQIAGGGLILALGSLAFLGALAP